MNTNLRRLLPLVLLLALVLTGHSTTGIDESLEFVSPPTGKKFIRWHGVPGWTYFVQVSDPADHLKTWTFAPIIEGGNNEPISYEIDEPPEGLPDKGFFRLKYTDQVPGPDETLDTARYVPLQQVGWVWGGKVSSADGWQAVTAKDQAAPVNPGGVECSDHPQWDGNTKADAEKPIQ